MIDMLICGLLLLTANPLTLELIQKTKEIFMP